MAFKTPPFKNYPLWTEARFWSFIRSALRQASSRYPVSYEVMKEGRRPYRGKDKRTKWEHLCARCDKWYKQKDIEKDHIIEAGRLACYDDLPGFVERMFPSIKGYQKLCKPCHKEKTRETKDANMHKV